MKNREIGEFKKYLFSNVAIKKNEEIIDLNKIVEFSYEFLNPGTNNGRKLRYTALGWSF